MTGEDLLTKLPDGYLMDANGKVIPGRYMYVKLFRMVQSIDGSDADWYYPTDSWRRARVAYFRYIKSIGGAIPYSPNQWVDNE